MVLIQDGFLKGDYPPGIKDLGSTVTAFENIVEAHGLAAQAIRDNMPPIKSDLPVHGVGLALNILDYTPYRQSGWLAGKDREVTDALSQISGYAFLKAVQTGQLSFYVPRCIILPGGFTENKSIPSAAHSLDWLGLNYYQHYQITFDPLNALGIRWLAPAPKAPFTDGTMDPSGLTRILVAASKQLTEKIPLIVSENGLADAEDTLRVPFIEQHLAAFKEARNAGVDVRGYWYWSLTDNFEWSKGYDPRFGLIAIDYKNLNRSIRPSGYWFRDFIDNHPGGP
jgi:beta-glucosidase